MGAQVTVCAKVPADLKKKLAESGINISEIIRKAMQSEAERLEKERLKKLLKEASVILQKIPPEEFIESIRASRDSR